MIAKDDLWLYDLMTLVGLLGLIIAIFGIVSLCVLAYRWIFG